MAGHAGRALGTVFHGYNLFDNTKFQVNAVKLFSNVMGADNLTVVGEYGAQWANVPDYEDGGFVMAVASSTGLVATSPLRRHFLWLFR